MAGGSGGHDPAGGALVMGLGLWLVIIVVSFVIELLTWMLGVVFGRA
jgi:hypothetical protein